MHVLDWGGDRSRRRGNFGVNVEHPIVTNGDVLRTCAKVREAIELSFGVLVSGVDPVIGVLDRGPRAPRGSGGFGPHH